jgi:formylglycine-generating enzyme required for sulfatase activity
MSPEQARGDTGELGAPTDVYAIGAMLYELLAGRAPYMDLSPTPDSNRVLSAVIAGAPTDLGRAAPNEPEELIAIARKAMAREKEQRYVSVAAMAADLRAFIEGRVVGAHERGGLALLRKWVLRNRSLAAALCGLLLVALSATALVLYVQRSRTKAALEQADARALASLREREESLWPSQREKLPAMQRWLDEARDLATRIPDYRAQLDALRRSSARPARADRTVSAPMRPLVERIALLHTEIAGLEEDIADITVNGSGLGKEQGIRFSRQEQQRRGRIIERLSVRIADHDAWEFKDSSARARSEELLNVISDGLELSDPIDGGIVRMERRMQKIQAVEQQSLVAGAELWSTASASIANAQTCPSYAGLQLQAQFALVPLGQDPHSGLWEFADVATGRVPKRDEQGVLQLTAEHGIVFVLLPPGEIVLGRDAFSDVEQVDVSVRLDAFFLGKHELTQAQWFRMTGDNPSYYRVGTEWIVPSFVVPEGAPVTTATWSWPVEQINWHQAKNALERFGLRLPTEAQWEYGCRAGTTTTWSLAETELEMKGKSNSTHGWPDGPYFDGWHITCPIGSFPANPWGLCEVHGNVAEWVLEPFWTTFRFPLRDGDGLSRAPESRLRTTRGGNIGGTAIMQASGVRADMPPTLCDRATGVRAMRAISPPLER